MALLIVQAVGLDIWVEPIRTHAPQAREYDMFRLRAVEGLTLERQTQKREPKNGVVARSGPVPRPPPRFRPRARIRMMKRAP
jgi:hypothetical protein